jgi:hypothetical protein
MEGVNDVFEYATRLALLPVPRKKRKNRLSSFLTRFA